MITWHIFDLEIMVHQVQIKQVANLKLLTFILSNANYLQKLNLIKMSYSATDKIYQ